MKHICKTVSVILFLALSVKAQYTSNVNLTATQLVNILVGSSPNLVVSNITSSWEDTADFRPVGSFKAMGTNIGLDSGIIMTTGNATDSFGLGPKGPDSWNTLAVMGYKGFLGSDAEDDDLTTASGYSALFDLAKVEFDFTACADTVQFRYVFGSEEYPGYVCSPYNDAFAFILSGGVTNPIPPTNLALIPGTTTPVSINTVNGGVSAGDPGGCGGPGDPGLLNTAYFVDNANGPTIAYTGFTVVLTAKHAIVAGELYHIKLVIADVSDGLLDSGVFLEAGSFITSPLPLDLVTNLTSSSGSIDTACTRQEVTVTNASNLAADSLNYEWDFDGATVENGGGKGPYTLKWQTPGSKKVKCTLNDCAIVSDSVMINVKICGIDYPNVFSPNNDGVNDALMLAGLEIFPSSKLQLYNRWGKKIYENANYHNDWKADDNVSDGVYYYVLELLSGEKRVGYVSIYRKT